MLPGSVPSFHLTQVLRESLQDIEHLERIVKHVDVVNSREFNAMRSCSS
ncbi:MAG: hypothetical protein R3C19_07075 [Planctomycetaceae bacterium]